MIDKNKNHLEDFSQYLEEWNDKSAKKTAEMFATQIDKGKMEELWLKIQQEYEKPIVDLNSFLIKINDEQINDINNLRAITEKKEYINSILKNEKGEDRKQVLLKVIELLTNIETVENSIEKYWTIKTVKKDVII